jgi:arginyl-tRNA synthetase
MQDMAEISEHLYATIAKSVATATSALVAAGSLPDGLDQSRVTVEPTRDAAHGDMATNAAMVLARPAKTNPKQLAEAIAEQLRADPLIAKAEIAGPGFINLTLKPPAWLEALRQVLQRGSDFGRSPIGAGEKINVEYVSANPTGPMHIGHCRGSARPSGQFPTGSIRAIT